VIQKDENEVVIRSGDSESRKSIRVLASGGGGSAACSARMEQNAGEDAKGKTLTGGWVKSCSGSRVPLTRGKGSGGDN